MLSLWIMVLPCRADSVPGGLVGEARTGRIISVQTHELDPAQIKILYAGKFLIAGREGNRFTLYGTPGDIDALRAAGISFDVLAEQYVPEVGTYTRSAIPDGYPSYADITAQLASWAALYPQICRLSSIGVSVNGQVIRALKLSDNVSLDETEPEVRLLSTIHGDEKAVLPICLRLIDFLLANYGQPTPDGQRVTALLDATEIWIVPVLNPDGYENHTRANANGMDLNRSFPDGVLTDLGSPFPERSYDTSGLEPEVSAVIDFSLAHHFVLSAGLHAGDLLIAYPYGNNDWGDNGAPLNVNTPTPDDATYRQVAGDWRDRHPEMTSIINAAQWYTVSGEMPDWTYRFLGTISITPELSKIKSPAASTHDGLWLQNRESLLAFLEIPAPLLRGIVTDAESGLPVYAEISVAGIERPVFSHPDHGDYHRLLQPGVYTLEVRAEGYETLTTSPVTISGDETVVDIALSAGPVEIETISLQPGWNAISLPRHPLDGRLDTLFDHNPPPSVWAWETDRFTAVDCLDAGPGYWIFMDRAAELSYSGTAPRTSVFPLPAGWAFSGFFAAIPADQLPPQINALYRWKQPSGGWRQANSTDLKEAFWLYLLSPVNLNVKTGQ